MSTTSVMLSRKVIATLGFLMLPLSLSHAEVTLSVGDGLGLPGSSNSQVVVSLENQADKVKGLQIDICDVDNYLSLTGCETTNRTTNFSCEKSELESGCCRILLISFSGNTTITEGTGPIFTLKYTVSGGAPSGECRDLNPENVKVSNEDGDPIASSDIIVEPGAFCFSSPVTTTTTTIITTTTTTTIKPSYKVTISPLSATIASGSTLQFTAKTTHGGEEVAGTYSWEIVPQSTIGSTIDENGLLTAGENDTGSDLVETVKVKDVAHQNIFATATVTIKVKVEPPPECEVTINPSAALVYPGDTLMLSALTTGNCETPQFQWSLKNSDTNSSIEPQGGSCSYTAGENNGGEPLTDSLTVNDGVNGVGAEAVITVLAEGVSIEVSPDSLWKSHWIPLPFLLIITGEGTHFEALKSTITFQPEGALFPFCPLVLGETFIWEIILVMPSWLASGEDQMVTVTVTTEDEEVSGDVAVKLLPFIFSQETDLP